MSAQTYVVGTIGAATLIVAGGQIAKGDTPSPRVFIGGTLAAVILSAAAGPVPGLARGLATLTIIGALLTSGYALAVPLARIVAGTT